MVKKSTKSALTAIVSAAIVFALLARSVQACPFCTPLKPTLCQRRAESQIAALAEALSTQPAQPPIARLKLHKVFAGSEKLAGSDELQAPLDLAAHPGSLVLVFGMGANDAPVESLSWHAEAVDETSYGYFARAPIAGTSDRLAYFVDFLEHPNALIAEDAYLEFAHAPFADVRSLADRLPVERIRSWLVDSGVPPQRKGFYGLALGLAKSPDARRTNAALLRTLIEQPEDDFRAGFDGVLGGWLWLEGEPGLQVVEDRYLSKPDAADGDVRHALAAIRFYYEYGRDIPPARLCAAVRKVLVRPEFAESATTDLARWQDWRALEQIAALYAKPQYNFPATKRAIVGYLLACPDPKAAEALAHLRETDPRGVAEAEQILSRTSSVPGRD